MRLPVFAILGIAWLPLFAGPYGAGGITPGTTAPLPGIPPILQKVGVDQKLNNQIPLDLTFRDEHGNTVELGQYFGKKPVVLAMVYYECPMLCNMVLNGMLRSFRAMSLDIGKDYDVLTVSFNPRERPPLARAKQVSYLDKYRRPGAENGWHFLTGDEANIAKLADAVGFHYAWDPTQNQYAHASTIMVLTPEGRIARYFFGIEYPTNSLRLSIVEASGGGIGSPVDAVLLYCFHYDATTGRYSLLITNVLKVAGAITGLGLFAMVLVLLRRERHHKVADYPC